ncbi:MAG TPA: DinB family protein [Cyclobacteriaceae bacterium]|nr:DinB family protein [Cyclobacteriaceae bacterium]
MKNVTQELSDLLAEYSAKFNAIPDSEFSNKPLQHKWSKKEVVGHLIDSAQNNLRRFIVGQYETQAPNIVYDQDFWVNVNGYQRMKKEEVIMLWKLINERICSVLNAMPEINYSKQCNTGKTEVQLHSLQWLAEDYIKHMKHHLNQVIPGSFNIIYK